MIGPDGKTPLMDLRLGQIIWSNGDERAWEALVGDEHIMALFHEGHTLVFGERKGPTTG